MTHSKFNTVAIWVSLGLTIILQCVAVDFQGKYVSLIILVQYLFLLSLLLLGTSTISVVRFVSIAVVFSFVGVLYFIVGGSPLSLFLVFLLYIAYSFEINCDGLKVLAFNQRAMCLISVFGMSQFLFQLAGFGYLDIYNFLPESVLIDGYNTTYPLVYGSPINKSNGFFLLEPSFYSQYLALAIIIEVVYFKRVLYLVLYAFAMLTAVSGTGLMLLAFFGLTYIFRREGGFKDVAYFAALIPVGIIVAYYTGFYEYFSQRLLNVAVEGDSSSFTIRFIAPVIALKEIYSASTLNVFFGVGAGNADEIKFAFETVFPSLYKLLIEYGVIGGSLIISLVVSYTRKINYQMSASLIFAYLFLSGAALQPQTFFYWYLLLLGMRRI